MWATRRADHPRGAEVAGHLARHAADGAGRRGHEDDVARVDGGDVGERDERCEAGRAERVQVGLRRGEVGVDERGICGVDHGVVAPAEEVRHGGTHCKRVGLRGDDLTHGGALHRLAELEGRDVRRRVVHPPAHVRVHRHPRVAHHDLTGSGSGHRGVYQLEIVAAGLAHGASGELDLARGQRRHGSSFRARFGAHTVSEATRDWTFHGLAAQL